MANQYCIQCGTLLPEDGVCLRCGAVYSFSEDGTLIIHPRKVKKVTAKTSVKKRIFAKRSLGLEEDDTQAINIPEDIFSHSDHRVNTEKHQDWTGEDEDYIPNFVFLDGEGDSYSSREDYYPEDDVYREEWDYQKESGYQESEPIYPVPQNSRNKGKGCARLFLFLVILALTSVFVFVWFGSSDLKKDKTTATSEDASATTAIQSTIKKPDPVFSASALQLEGSWLEDDNATYSFNETTGLLEVDYKGSCPSGVLLLPLFDGPDLTKKHFSLATIARSSFWSLDEALCESDFITRGIIKEIDLFWRKGDSINDLYYLFEVSSGKLQSTTVNEVHYSDNNTVRSELVTEISYSYNSQGQLTLVSSKKSSYSNDMGISEIKLSYDENGFLSQIKYKTTEPDFTETYTETLEYSGNQLKSLTPDKSPTLENGVSIASFEYDTNGGLARIRKITHDVHENTEIEITNNSSEEIVKLYMTGIEMGDTYTFTRK